MKLGKRVLGEEAFAVEEAAHQRSKSRAFKYGSRVVGDEEAPAPVKAAAPPPPAPPEKTEPPEPTTDASSDGPKKEPPAHTLSLTEMKRTLAGDPPVSLLDELIDSEFKRPEGQPRKGALMSLLRAENARGDETRPTVVAELTGALEAL